MKQEYTIQVKGNIPRMITESKIYNREYGFDITTYLLRARHTWKSHSKFIDRESAIV